jgi:type III pantothenate kinase
MVHLDSTLLIDVGNTLIKCYQGVDLVLKIPVDLPYEQVHSLFEEHGLSARSVVMSSISSRGDALVEQWVCRRGGVIKRIGQDIPVVLETAYPAGESLGMDRQLMSLAFIDGWGEVGTVICLGTAVTVDIIADGKHCGGSIAPGLDLLARALADNTGVLPLVDCREMPERGGGTDMAIFEGCRSMYESYFDFQLMRASERGPVVVSGGAAPECIRGRNVEYCENLVARGMALAYRDYEEQYG